MKRCILVDSAWELKRYLLKFEDRQKIVIDPYTESKISRLDDLLFSYQLLEKPIVVAKSVDEWNKDEIKWFISALKKSFTDVIVTSKNAGILKKFGEFEDLSSPKPWEVKKWIDKIEETSRSLSISLSDEARDELFNRVGTNIDLISKELEKLAAFSKRLTFEDVQEYVPIYTEPTVFEFIHSFLEKKLEVFDLLRETLKTTHPLAVVRNLEIQCTILAQMLSQDKITYSWKNVAEAAKIFKVKTPQIAELVGFPLGGKKRTNILNLWKFDEIVEMLKDIQEVEIGIKNGKDPNFLIMKMTRNWVFGTERRR